MIEEIVKIHANDFRPLLDVEKYHRLYKISNVVKLDFGYVCQLSFLKLKIECLCKPKKDGLEIIEKYGKFVISITYEKKKEGEVEAHISYKGSLEKILGNLVHSIGKNLEEYGKYIVTKSSGTSNLVSLNLSTIHTDKVIDLRGEECPVPEITLKRELTKAKVGQVIEILLDHPAAILYTVPEIIRLFNCRYEVIRHEDYVTFKILVLSNKIGREELLEVLHQFEENKIREMFKDKQFISFLYTVFTKIVKTENVSDFKEYNFNCGDNICLVSSAPLGRGWLFTGILKGNKMVSCRIDSNGSVLFDEDALNYLRKLSGDSNVIYMTY